MEQFSCTFSELVGTKIKAMSINDALNNMFFLSIHVPPGHNSSCPLVMTVSYKELPYQVWCQSDQGLQS